MKKIILKIIVASIFFLGLLPILVTWRDSLRLQGAVFLLSVVGYAIAEIIVGTEHGTKPMREKVGGLRNTLFLAILFLALAMLTKEWLSASWSAQLQTGFLMLAATYYSVTLMQVAFLREGAGNTRRSRA